MIFGSLLNEEVKNTFWEDDIFHRVIKAGGSPRWDPFQRREESFGKVEYMN